MPPTSGQPPLLEMHAIDKSYEGVRALDGASLAVAAGEVHALLGENGAGKSTLVKILAGAVERDAGTLSWEGRPVEIASRRDATDLGVGIVFQHAELIDELSIAENISLGRERARAGFVDRSAARRLARDALERVRAPLRPERAVRGLRAGERQLVEIARAIAFDVRLLVLDEPTASLGEREVDNLFRIVRELRDDGIGIVYISHRLPEIFELSDRVTVLRDGRTVETVETESTNRDALVAMMVGRDLTGIFRKVSHAREEVTLSVRDLASDGGLDGVSFDLHAGEVLGVYGLLGSGRTELARAIVGADRVVAGTIELDGAPARLGAPSAAVRRGVGLVPEERVSQGTFQGLSVRENLTAARGDLVATHGWVRGGRERRRAREVVERLRIRTRSIEAPVSTLSGGNQQKVVFGRWLIGDTRVLVLDEPTAGVDVGAKEEIYGIISDLAAGGTAVLLMSSELPELLGLADRLLVMRDGHAAGLLDRERMSEAAALELALAEAA
jgi:ribose transport system ATP-binding protein